MTHYELSVEQMQDFIATDLAKLLGSFVTVAQTPSNQALVRASLRQAIIPLVPDTFVGKHIDVQIDDNPVEIERGRMLISFVPLTEIGKAFLDKIGSSLK